jgi:hypothetical protein
VLNKDKPTTNIFEKRLTMQITGHIKKMRATLEDTIQYHLPMDDQLLAMNDLLGSQIQIQYNGLIHCSHCGRKTNKSYSQGYCYPCMQSLASCDMCIMKPETCHYDQGTCRQPEWGEENCMIEHVVYLANSSGLKVGITRHSQIPTRWIDQGAIQAIPMFRVKTRKQSGLVEDALKAFVADKTNWRAMLKGEVELLDMQVMRDKMLAEALPILEKMSTSPGLIQENEPFYQVSTEAETKLNFPVLKYPTKIKSFNLDKTPTIEGTLEGIKGQYLIFDTGVINMRKYSSYQLSITKI